MGITINRSGALTTVQDLGRIGHQNLGFAASGAMDHRACRLANLLLDNDPGDAVLEVTLQGPKFTFTEPECFVVTGADLQMKLNGRHININQVYAAQAGDVVEFPVTFPSRGVRSYIGFAGGLDVPLLMGSRSTYLRGKMGGLEGRKLQKGDTLGFTAPKPILPQIGRRFVPEHFDEVYGGPEIDLRIVLGPQEEAFTPYGIATFFQNAYLVSPQMDRMGTRLDGPVVEHRGRADIVSDGIAFGAIQVPQNGKPIILMADRQPTGGYTKLGNVISVDIPKLAQRSVGDKIHFKAVTVQKAQELLRQEMDKLQNLAAKWRK